MSYALNLLGERCMMKDRLACAYSAYARERGLGVEADLQRAVAGYEEVCSARHDAFKDFAAQLFASVCFFDSSDSVGPSTVERHPRAIGRIACPVALENFLANGYPLATLPSYHRRVTEPACVRWPPRSAPCRWDRGVDE